MNGKTNEKTDDGMIRAWLARALLMAPVHGVGAKEAARNPGTVRLASGGPGYLGWVSQIGERLVPAMVKGAAVLAGMTALTVPAAAQDAMLNASVGLCETALRQGKPDIASPAETLGFYRKTLPNGVEGWQLGLGSNLTLVVSRSAFCVIALNRDNQTSKAKEAFESWARASNTSFGAAPNGDKVGEKDGFTYRYSELSDGTAALYISRQHR